MSSIARCVLSLASLSSPLSFLTPQPCRPSPGGRFREELPERFADLLEYLHFLPPSLARHVMAVFRVGVGVEGPVPAALVGRAGVQEHEGVQAVGRRLHQGLRRISLHAAMSTLAYTATALLQVQAGATDFRWMVRRVA